MDAVFPNLVPTSKLVGWFHVELDNPVARILSILKLVKAKIYIRLTFEGLLLK